MLPKTTPPPLRLFLKPHNRLCFNFFQWVPDSLRALADSWLVGPGRGTWNFNLLFWNRHRFSMWGSDNHLALALQPYLSVCLVDLMLQTSGHGCGHVAVQPLTSGGGCTCLLLSPFWFMGWKRPVQLELKCRGTDIDNLMEGKTLSLQELLFMLAWPYSTPLTKAPYPSPHQLNVFCPKMYVHHWHPHLL